MSRLSFFAVVCACALALPARGQDKPQPQTAPPSQSAEPPAAKPADVASPDAILAATYDVISGPAGPRDWDRFNSLFRSRRPPDSNRPQKRQARHRHLRHDA